MFHKTLSRFVVASAISCMAVPSFAAVLTSSASANTTVWTDSLHVNFSLSAMRYDIDTRVIVNGQYNLSILNDNQTYWAGGNIASLTFSGADKCSFISNFAVKGEAMRAEVFITKNATASLLGWRIFRSADNSLVTSSGDNADGSLKQHPTTGGVMTLRAAQ